MSSKLLAYGYYLKGGNAEKHRLLTFTVGYSEIPGCICLYTEQAFTSENIALTQAILAYKSNHVPVFDRGIPTQAG